MTSDDSSRWNADQHDATADPGEVTAVEFVSITQRHTVWLVLRYQHGRTGNVHIWPQREPEFPTYYTFNLN